LLRLQSLTVARGTQSLITDAQLTVFPGQKWGLIGANGSGKSTLFAALSGRLAAESGSISIAPQWRVAHVEQHVARSADSALEFVLAGHVDFLRVRDAIAHAEHAAIDGESLASLHAEFEALDGYVQPARAAELLAGLGFDAERQQASVDTFSGGWRMRLALARALMAPSDLLLLDEPTNYLDLDAVIWLEDWLRRYPGALIVITHDRDFLDAVVEYIAHIDQRQLTSYRGNYSAFEDQRAERLAAQQGAFERQQRQIAHIQSYIDRFKAKATKAKQAQSRMKTLERMQRITAAHVDSPFRFQFANPTSTPRQLFVMDKTAVGYGDKRVVGDIEWSFWFGDRIGLLGPNGAGKSTLLKTLVGELPAIAGELQRHDALTIGYFSQYTVDSLRLDMSPLWHIQRLAPEARETDLRAFLGGFDFRGDKALEPVGPFSGGEKARLALAVIVFQKPNLLVLDEPTNHLDIDMREALAEALQDYEGGLIVVAHDRHLLKATCDEYRLVADGRVVDFDGDLDSYRDWVFARRRAERSALREEQRPVEPEPDRRAQRRQDAERRIQLAQLRRPIEKRLAEVDKTLHAHNAERSDLNQRLADPAVYEAQARAEIARMVHRQGQLAQLIDELEEEWLQLNAQLETVAA
jgi:ATP-binding cassette, subfamily F, member 3